jgi:hypothetical protein
MLKDDVEVAVRSLEANRDEHMRRIKLRTFGPAV